ncbi:C40 family peptidase [bacterium]|nr:C40 family peptidase [bacterium]
MQTEDNITPTACKLARKFIYFMSVILFFSIFFFPVLPLSAATPFDPLSISTHLLDDYIHMVKFNRLLKVDTPMITGPDSSGLEPYLGLAEDQSDSEKDGPISRMQKLLLSWNKNLPLKVSGHYDKATAMSVTLYKLVHDCGFDGSFIDRETAHHLLAMEYNWPLSKKETSLVAQVLNEAVKFLGLRYRLGGSGVKYIDCGMFTRMAMISAGIAEKVFNRTAAMQYRYAEQGDMGLFLRPAGEPPQPGDLVFFNWRTRFQNRRYKGITHVGFFLGQVGDRLLVLEAASRGERRVTIKDRSDSISRIAGYAQIVGPPPGTDIFDYINMAAEDLENLMVPKLGDD